MFSVFFSRPEFLSVKNPKGSELTAGNLVDGPLKFRVKLLAVHLPRNKWHVFSLFPFSPYILPLNPYSPLHNPPALHASLIQQPFPTLRLSLYFLFLLCVSHSTSFPYSASLILLPFSTLRLSFYFLSLLCVSHSTSFLYSASLFLLSLAFFFFSPSLPISSLILYFYFLFFIFNITHFSSRLFQPMQVEY